MYGRMILSERDGFFCIYFSIAFCTEEACISLRHGADKQSIFFWNGGYRVHSGTRYDWVLHAIYLLLLCS